MSDISIRTFIQGNKMSNNSQNSDNKQQNIKKTKKVKIKTRNVNILRIKQPRHFIFSC